ncbi:MAG: DNA repair protein RadC [Myxococcota bacterium]|nr:DNA repair protein RadC [Myxococcota bacterium]
MPRSEPVPSERRGAVRALASRPPAASGPRERLLEQGAGVLSDEELVSLLLGSGGPGRSAAHLSRTLLASHQGLTGLARAGLGELLATAGIGPAKGACLAAALELGRRVAGRRLRPGDAIGGPEDVFRHLHPRLRDARCERFLVLVLDGRHRLVREFQASQGTLTASLVHPREVFRPALSESGAAVVLAHNHPSGDPTPSPEDRQITDRLIRAGQLLGVPVVDHVVVAERGFTSLREEGRCRFEP